MMDISLIITNYNREKYISRAINSCLNQLVNGIKVETIVVDDASTDGSVDIIQSFLENIKLIKHVSNQGVSATSNSGIINSQGKYIMRVDADDFLSSYACQVMYMILKNNPDFGFVYCDHIRVDENGKREDLIRLDTNEKLYQHGAGILFRRESLFSINLYDKSIRNAEDYDLLIRLHKEKIKGFYLPVPLYRYYIHGANMTLNKDRNQSIIEVKKKHKIN